MKRFFWLVVSFVFSFVSFANGVVNIYTTRHYNDVDKLLFEEFEKETGIKVKVEFHNNDANLVIQKIKAEGKKTGADVFLNVGFADLDMAKKEGILGKITDKSVLSNVPKHLRDKDDYYTGISYRARVIVYNPDKVKKEELSTYEDLANSKWKGRIITRTSTSSYNKHLISFMVAQNGEKKTLDWAKGLVNNFARDPHGNDRDQIVAVYNGVADLAIVNTYYMGRLLNDKDPVKVEAAKKLKIFFPNQKNGGTHINIAGASIVKNGQNKENAQRFIKFLTDKKAQEIITNKNYEFPVNKNVKPNELILSWGNFEASKIPFNKISENYTKSALIAGAADWK